VGHIGVKDLRQAVDGAGTNDTQQSSCPTCAKANISQNPFPQKASHRATRLLERIHSDICGPLPISYRSYRYFILFICCHSRYIFLYFLKSRSEAAQRFIEFRSQAETFSREKIAILRVDNAPELTQGALQAECNRTGITYEKTVPDSPSQNGVAERCNRTLVSMARAMIIDAKLPEWFWTFAIQAAVHIKNRVPHSALPAHKTPFELWFHYKPNLSHLRLFGAYCTSRITPASGTKLSPRGEHGRHLGYAKDARGYIVWVPNATGPGGSVKVRRDVKFHDDSLLENAESWQNGNHEYDAGTPEGPAPTHEACAIYYPRMGIAN
jgi:transposase InsO family protein